MAEQVHIHRLAGCTPTPLASYLKALAVLRLLSSPTANVHGRPADPDARGWWQDEGFHLRTRLDRDALVRFFLDDYAPSPIVAPWNGGSGFFFREGKTDETDPETGKRIKTGVRDAPTEATRRLDSLAGAQAPRLAALAGAIACAREILDEMGLRQAPTDVQKPALMNLLRSRAAEPVADWIDAAMTVLDTRFEASALLGSGGNDGNLDFSTTFHGALLRLIDPGSGQVGEDAEAALACALFDTPTQRAGQAGISQLAPGRMKGAENFGTGFQGDAPETVWSVVLLFEGALTFAGTATRRGEAQRVRASFPFTVQQTAAGSGAVAGENDASSRPFELWLPLWTRPVRYDEAQALFGEGRAHVGRAAARDGLSFARAVSQLGVSRGITELVRLGFEPRNGNMFLSVPLGRFRTPKAPREDLVADLDWGAWLSRLSRLASRSEAPARLQLCLRRLDDALIALTRADGQAVAGQALIALGEVVAWVASSRSAIEILPPPPRLSSRWIFAADDRTVEFRIAEALASLGWSAEGTEQAAVDQDGDRHVEPPGEEGLLPQADPTAHNAIEEEMTVQDRPRVAPAMAVHFASVEPNSVAKRQRRWADAGSRSVVWGGGGLVANMIAVLERRLVEHAAAHFTDKGLDGRRRARLEDIATFLAGPPAFDDARCAALLAGMVWAQPRKAREARPDDRERTAGPFAYAALKPIFARDALLHDLQALPSGRSLPIPPGLVTLLRRGDTDTAVRQALVRARASGLPSPFDPARIRAGATSYGAGLVGARLAAALLIPVAEDDLKAVLRRAYPDALPKTKETNDAA